MLVFRTGGDRTQALPLSLVARLEEIDSAQFQKSAGRTLLHYGNRLVPVTPLGQTKLCSEGLQPLIIVSNGELNVALAVESIIDIVEEPFALEMTGATERGVIGSAMIRGRATDIVDLSHYLPLDEPGWFGMPAHDRSESILLVEPSEFLREMLSPVLKASGRAVLAAADPSTALDLARDSSPRAILVDLDRDTDAALRLIADLRSAAAGRPVRILGLTALVTPDLQIRANRVGADDVHAKFDRRALLSELHARGEMRDAA